MIFISFCFFSEVCVDKARIDEYEQRASELAQKASIDQKKKSKRLIFSSDYTSTWQKQIP